MMLLTKSVNRVVHYHQPGGLSTLFRPLPKVKGGTRPPLDVTYQASNGGPVLRFSAKAALGIPEQTLLLVLLELAQERFVDLLSEAVVSANTENEIGRTLWSQLHQGWRNDGEQTLMLATTWYDLNRRCGSQTGGTTQSMREQQLERLCEVIVWEHAGDAKKTRRQSYLVAWLIGDDERIHLALNCRLASAILGQPYSQVSIVERLSLQSDVQMALHAFLSTTIAVGKTLKIGVERLIERLWPSGADTVHSSTHRSRRGDVKAGLDAVGRLAGWSVQWERNDLAAVSRLRPGVADMTSHNGNKTSSYRQRPLPIIINKNNGLGSFDASVLFFNSESATLQAAHPTA